MTTDQIRFFMSLATQLNFRTVAERFFITQPTLSRQIASLEAELKVKLFERGPKGVALTPAGETFYKGISEVYRDMQEVIYQTRKIATRQETSLVVGVQDDQCINPRITHAIQQFRAVYPDVRVVLNRVPTNELYDGLLTGELDIINMIDVDGQYLRGVGYEVLTVERTCVAMHRAMAERYPDGITTEELEQLTQQIPLNLLSPDHFANGSEPVQSLVKNIGLHPENARCYLDADPASISLRVASGLCISVSNESNILSQDPGVVLVPIRDGAPIRTLMMWKPVLSRQQTADFLNLFRTQGEDTQ